MVLNTQLSIFLISGLKDFKKRRVRNLKTVGDIQCIKHIYAKVTLSAICILRRFNSLLVLIL